MTRGRPNDALALLHVECVELAAFLRTRYPQDVLMPVGAGSKHPRFAHKGGAWTWASYDEHVRAHRERAEEAPHGEDVAVLLKQLCVVDVDSKRRAEELEAQHPVLQQVPCEETARGRHYWFERPDCADAEGFFDGASQVEHGVDFKSVCRTGTSGVVVVTPSAGKTWVRPPWRQGALLTELPYDLLRAVAMPRRARALGITLCFQEDKEVVHIPAEDAAWLTEMGYFEPLLSGEDGAHCPSGLPLPVPGCSAELLRLLRVLRHDSLHVLGPREDPTHATHEALLRTADALDLSPALFRRLAAGRTRRQVDVFELSPGWWAAMRSELAPEGSEEILVPLSDSLQLRFEPLSTSTALSKDAWLLPQLRRPMGSLRSQGLPQLRPDPTGPGLAASMPRVVVDLLRSHPGHLVLAGGAALSLMCPQAEEAGDWDLFVVGLGAQDATALVQSAWRTVERVHPGSELLVTQNAVTVLCRDGEQAHVVQLVLRLNATVQELLLSFDVAPSRVAVWAADSDGWAAVAAPSWVAAVRHMAFPLELEKWSHAMVARVLKYHMKGFDVALPGARSGAMLKPRGTLRHIPGETGLRVLFAAEASITRTRKLLGWREPRVVAQELRAFRAHSRAPASGYDVEELKLSRRLYYVMREVVRNTGAQLQWLMSGPSTSHPHQQPQGSGAPAAPSLGLAGLKWRTEPFPRCAPSLSKVYDMELLQRELMKRSDQAPLAATAPPTVATSIRRQLPPLLRSLHGLTCWGP